MIQGLPDDQVEAVLADVRRLAAAPPDGQWPPRFFGIGESNDGRTDHAEGPGQGIWNRITAAEEDIGDTSNPSA